MHPIVDRHALLPGLEGAPQAADHALPVATVDALRPFRKRLDFIRAEAKQQGLAWCPRQHVRVDLVMEKADLATFLRQIDEALALDELLLCFDQALFADLALGDVDRCGDGATRFARTIVQRHGTTEDETRRKP